MPTIPRRAFFALAVQTVAGAAGLLAGCTAPATPTPTTATAPTAPPATQAPPLSTATRPAVAAAPPTATAPGAVSAATPVAPTATASGGPAPHLAVVKGDKPAAITRKAVEALGGIGQFVKPGQRVLIKPNICTPQAPEYAATTNPEVVATLVSLCKEAGAARVLVVDYPFGGNAAYRVSGIEAAVKAAGGDVEQASRLKFKNTPIPQGKDIKSWPIYEDALAYDVLINVPIAKNHNLATLTLSMKNLMGLIENRGALHSNIGQRLADVSTVVRPQLIVIDAVRILLRNGPTGGNLRDVQQANTVVVSTDPVAADAYAATLFGMKGDDLSYVRAGAAMGLGQKDLAQLRIADLSL